MFNTILTAKVIFMARKVHSIFLNRYIHVSVFAHMGTGQTKEGQKRGEKNIFRWAKEARVRDMYLVI